MLQAIGDPHVAVITDETVADLYGPLVFGALQKAGLKPEIAAVPAGERHKTIRQAKDLLDWLTVLRFTAGALGVIDNSRHAGYGFECSAEILGADSAIRLGVGVQAEDNIDRHEPAYRDELREFVACVANGHDPAVGGEDALEALRLALAAERSVA